MSTTLYSLLHAVAVDCTTCFTIGCPRAQRELGERHLRSQIAHHTFLHYYWEKNDFEIINHLSFTLIRKTMFGLFCFLEEQWFSTGCHRYNRKHQWMSRFSRAIKKLVSFSLHIHFLNAELLKHSSMTMYRIEILRSAYKGSIYLMSWDFKKGFGSNSWEIRYHKYTLVFFDVHMIALGGIWAGGTEGHR